MTPPGEALNALHRYVQLQHALLSALRGQVSSEPLSAQLGNIPRHGMVAVQAQEWQFTRHGAGVEFRETRSGCTVDVPTEIDNPELFDLWRLRTYFGSLGRAGVRLLERASGKRGMPMLHALEALLNAWHRSGEIHGADGLFSLSVREELRG